jgi:hypothetical protein
MPFNIITRRTKLILAASALAVACTATAIPLLASDAAPETTVASEARATAGPSQTANPTKTPKPTGAPYTERAAAETGGQPDAPKSSPETAPPAAGQPGTGQAGGGQPAPQPAAPAAAPAPQPAPVPQPPALPAPAPEPPAPAPVDHTPHLTTLGNHVGSCPGGYGSLGSQTTSSGGALTVDMAVFGEPDAAYMTRTFDTADGWGVEILVCW